MSKVERLSSLKQSCHLDFWGLSNPRCPHCGVDYDVNEREAWHLYEEGGHEIECPSCDLPYHVSVNVSYSYSTDEQEEE